MPGRTAGLLLAVVAAAGLTVAPAGAAAARPARFGPSGGPAAATASKAGYVAGRRDFRYAQAEITVPDQSCTVASPKLYVALDATAGNADYTGPASNARCP